MHHTSVVWRRPGALAPVAALLLALCLLAVGVQAMTDPADTAALVTGAGEIENGTAADIIPLADANTTIEPNTTTTPAVRALAPYPGSHPVPGEVQAEDFDAGGETIAYHDTTPGNSGGAYRQDDVDIEVGASGYDVGWIRTGEFLTYEVYVEDAGTFQMTARVASPNSGRTIAVSDFGDALATVAVPNTGSFSTYRTVSVPVTLTSGFHALKLTFAGDGQNLDWIAFGTGPASRRRRPHRRLGAGGASFRPRRSTAAHGSAVKFTVTPASGKSIGSVLWSFDAPAHLNTWNSRAVSPTFFYPSAGTFSPLVKITYTDGSSETVQRTGYIRAT